ncbi:unnamed protein product [Mycena citricolor]|uniref:Uncharacterized protein n=1 Tax=Mycena citricolor TaxID=2018698 RepID=A0AAD2HG45_9AGAR|nr:unnamed protein product [Mycena citricolor]
MHKAPIDSAPSTPRPLPRHPSSHKPFINAVPSRPPSRYGSSTYSFSSGSTSFDSSLSSGSFDTTTTSSSSSPFSSSPSSRSTSGSSFSSTTSAVGSVSPKKRSQFLPGAGPSTPGPPSPKKPSSALPRTPGQARLPNALLMLRKDVEFVPQSPKRPPGSSVGKEKVVVGPMLGNVEAPCGWSRSTPAMSGTFDMFTDALNKHSENGIRCSSAWPVHTSTLLALDEKKKTKTRLSSVRFALEPCTSRVTMSSRRLATMEKKLNEDQTTSSGKCAAILSPLA